MGLEAMRAAGDAFARGLLGPRGEVVEAALPSGDRTVSQAARQAGFVSVDVLRGFTILWIVGGDALAGSVARVAQEQGGIWKSFGDAVAVQLSHSHWEGLHFYDLIFPLFLFVSGVSIVLSLERFVENGDHWGAWRRIGRRTAMLLLLGLLVGGGLAEPWPQVRLMGVLQRLALCYLAASLIYLYGSHRTVATAIGALLIGYWLALTFVPVPGLGHASYEQAANLARWIDQHALPGRLWYHTWDPEGLFSTLPAIASCLIGVMAGQVLTDRRLAPERRSLLLMAGGLAALIAGLLWGQQFPMVKKIWTSSYALAGGGWSLLLLGMLYVVADVGGRHRWANVLVWLGANAILLYLIQNLIGFELLAKRLAGGDVAAFLDSHVSPGAGLLGVRVVAVGLVIVLARAFYQRGVFIRV